MKIIMIDQDGVVCNERYQPTSDIRHFAKRMWAKHMLIPNSDTPRERLARNFLDMLSVEPSVIIAERGAVIQVGSRCHYVGAVLQRNEYLQALESTCTRLGVLVITTDAATLIRLNVPFPPNRQLLLIDSLRERSICFFLKESDYVGFTKIDPKWSSEMLDIIRAIPLPIGLAPPDYNPAYGVAVCNVIDASKTAGYRKLRESFPNADYYMVGDSNSDIIGDERVVHCAVGNATEKLKQRSLFTSSHNYTEGLAECLEWIDSR